MIRSAYGVHQRVRLDFSDEVSRTKQSFKAECDISTILRKFQKTGILEHQNKHAAQYGVAQPVDFKTAMDVVARGKSLWEDLPSSLKQRFGSPEAFVDFVDNDENLEEARELGLVPKLPVVAPEAPLEPLSTPAPAEGPGGDSA